ncbi:Organic cation/carnitine transporter 4 [Acorus gramineus]|uniref:H(+)/Pi cotransporter n=1 Tax=Acorus gramineus TaxID=55184 RepID=A0AAV9BW67_ACOGR|nr:Organic cation/carnitine transporter 4 [Acorus gramineus]
MGIDEMLERHAGEFGPWQLRHFVLTSLAWSLSAFHTMVVVFADREPDWRCTDRAGTACLPQPPRTMCGLDPGSWEWTDGPGSSTVAAWGLVCGSKYKIGLAQSGFFVGNMIGSGIFGHLADSSFGRKRSLIAVCVASAAFGCLTSLSPSFWLYAALRFLTGLSSGGMGLCSFVLATEPVGPSARGMAGMSTYYFYSVGIAALSGVAYLTKSSWRVLYFATSLPSLAYALTIHACVSESPRWYLVRRRPVYAMRVMHAIAAGNGRSIPDGVSLALDSVLDVLRAPITRARLCVTVLINFITSMVYYGLSLNVTNLNTNLHINVVLNAAAEVPAFALTTALLDQIGRKPLTIGTMWLAGAACLIGGSLGSMKTARMVCAVFGIFAMSGTFNLLGIYAAELFPTVVRNVALGCMSQSAQLGAILAPLVVVFGGAVPFAVFGMCGVLGGVIGFYLPETKNRAFFETMEGLEADEKVRLRQRLKTNFNSSS